MMITAYDVAGVDVAPTAIDETGFVNAAGARGRPPTHTLADDSTQYRTSGSSVHVHRHHPLTGRCYALSLTTVSSVEMGRMHSVMT